MNIFDKCEKFTVAKKVMATGCYPYFHCVESGQDPEVIIEGRKVIMMGSNNYLGLTSYWRLKASSIRATQKYGVGCVGSRFLNGTLDIHEELEKKLAVFVRKERALLFSTGMQANLGALSSLVGKNDVVITDKYDHASIIDGCRLSFGQMKRFKHNDMRDLERILIPLKDITKLIVVDGIFSMEGDIVNLPEIVRLGKKYNAQIMVDDAHSLGVLGKQGRGTCDHFGLTDEVDIIMGTFSKSLASIGGFIAANESIIHYLKHNARALIFSASPSPSNVASVITALDVIKKDTYRIKRLWRNTHKMMKGFKGLGFDTGTSDTPIIPIVVGDDFKAFQMWRMLFDQGIFTTPIVSPAVPPGRALIRVSNMATHTDKQLDKVLQVFGEVGRELGIINPVDKKVVVSSVNKKRFRFWKEINRDMVKKWMKRLWHIKS
ncbi:aminotransferase class I/II-fold pyridoxal phosphate-dependent enzyme [bacterium]|nr:aminotransferase class I/II-fold pyridoxal phosphate-dependent enzyme [bacterium]